MTETQPFEHFMRAYQNLVYATAVRLLANEAEAEDIAQEVFLKAYEHFDEIGASPTAGGWLRTVTRNLCLNHLSRYRARWRFFSEFATDPDDESGNPVDRIPCPAAEARNLDNIDHRELLEDALHRLPETQRVPLVLFHFENLSYEAIAAKLGLSLSKVKTDIFRGREALRRKLEWRLSEPERLEQRQSARPCFV